MATEAKRKFMNRFIEYQANPHIIDLMENHEIMQYRRMGPTDKPVRKTHWLILGFHPMYEKTVAKGLTKFMNSDWRHVGDMIFGERVDIRIAWFNRMKNITNLIRSMTKSKMKKDDKVENP